MWRELVARRQPCADLIDRIGYGGVTVTSRALTVEYEDKRVRRIPEGLFLASLGIALVSITGGLWWALPASGLCLIPVMTPRRVVSRIFPTDEEWIARIKLGFGVMAIMVIIAFVSCLYVIGFLPGQS